MDHASGATGSSPTLRSSPAISILLLLAGVAIFLLAEAWPAITADPVDLPEGKTLVDYIAPLAFGTVLAATLAIVIAVPLAVAVALFISHYAPRRLALPLGYVVDLLAAIPSIVYGLWGIVILGPAVVPSQEWLADNLGWIPFFEGPASATGRTMLVVGLVLAVMTLPIVSAVAREVFTQTPRRLQEGALALGATRWEMIRMTVLPFGKSAVISGAMLGLGRALGETMAVTIILSVSGAVTFNLISSANPSHDRRQHRARLPRVLGYRRQRPDRLRARPLRDHPRRQHGRPRGHLPLAEPAVRTDLDGQRRLSGNRLRNGRSSRARCPAAGRHRSSGAACSRAGPRGRSIGGAAWPGSWSAS